MAEFLQFAFSGLTVGAIYALVALGFTLIFNSSDVVNFAQGEFVMLGGMVTVFTAAAGVPLPLAALLAIVVTVAVGLLLHRLAIEPARAATPVTLIIITIGASILIRGFAAILFDKNYHSLPPFISGEPIIVGGAALLPQSLVVLMGVVLVVVMLWAFLTRTITGKAMLATAANRLAARLVGINTSAVVGLSFMISAAIGAFGGIIVAPITLTNYDVGSMLALKALPRRCSAEWAIRWARSPADCCSGCWKPSPRATCPRNTKTRSPSLSSCWCCSPCRKVCSAAAKSNGCNVARLLNNPLLLVVGLALVVALLPLFLPSTFYVRVVALVFINALAVLGLNLLMGFAGQVSLGHAGFFGIGAYAVAVGPTHLSMPAWLSLICGTALAALVAFIVGRPILKLRGYYLAVATLGMGMLIAMVVSNEAQITGGPNGMPVPRLVLFGWRAAGPQVWYWISGVTLVIGVWIAINLIESPTGRAFRAIHDSETAARVLGVNVARYKLIAFVLSAAYAAVAGSYFVLFDGFVTPETIELPALDRIRRHGRAGRARFDFRQHRRRRHPGFAAAVSHGVSRLRAHRARRHHYCVPDFPAGRHRSCGLIFPQTAAGMSILVVEDLAISFGGLIAVDGVTFAVQQAEIFAVIGPNGAGKTTLFNMVSGLYTPHRGRILLADEDITSLAPHELARRGLSRTFQNLQIFFRMTAIENVMVGRHLHEKRNVLSHLFTLPSVHRQNQRHAGQGGRAVGPGRTC